MQVAALPKWVIIDIERLCRRFFWGECGDERWLHTINWRRVCLPRAEGGLGIPCLPALNQVLLEKAGWRKLTCCSTLCNQILHKKYGSWATVGTLGSSRPISSTWRGIQVSVGVLRKGIQWRLGSSEQECFWLDSWLGERPLILRALMDIANSEIRAPVRTYWSESMSWKWDVLEGKLPAEVLHLLAAIMLHPPGSQPDISV